MKYQMTIEIETKIIQGICDAKTNKVIAKELGLSVPNLNLKIKNIFIKYQVTTRFELIYKVATKGLLP